MGAVTLVLQNSMTWAMTILKNQPLMVNNLDPAVTSGNMILQRVLGAPFRWRFNRGKLSFSISGAGGTDYIASVSDLGRMEKMWIVDGKGNIFALTGEVELAPVSALGRPTLIAPVYDDNNGNITFRLNFTPDAAYTVFIDYQRKPQLIISPSSPWGLVPDEFSYVFNQGFLSLVGLLTNDARFPIWEQFFVSSLLGTQDGLDEQAINIFLGGWLNDVRTIQRSAGAVQSGIAGRGK